MSCKPHDSPVTEILRSAVAVHRSEPSVRFGAIAAAIWLVLAFLPAATGQSEPPLDPALAEKIHSHLHSLVTIPCSDPQKVEDDLYEMGPAVLRVFQTLDRRYNAPVQVGVIGRVRSRLSDRTVSLWLTELTATAETVATRVAAYRCLEAVGTEEGLPGLLDSLAAESLSVRRCADRALVALLRRSNRAECYELVREKLTTCSKDLRVRLIISVARADSPHGMLLLGELLGSNRDQDLMILSHLAGMSTRSEDSDLVSHIRPLLDPEDPELSCAAATALANIHDVSSAKSLVDLLGAQHPEVARAAHAALTRLASKNLPADPVLWRDWLASETAWWEAEGSLLLRTMWEGDDIEIPPAIFSCAEHPLYRYRFAERIQIFSTSPDRLIREAAASVQARPDPKRPSVQNREPEQAVAPQPPRERPPQRKPSRNTREAKSSGEYAYFFLFLIGAGVVLALLVRLSTLSPMERLRAWRGHTNGPIILSLDRETIKPEPSANVTAEELRFRSARKKETTT